MAYLYRSHDGESNDAYTNTKGLFLALLHVEVSIICTYTMANELHHPTGVLVDVVGINSSNRGRSCEEHEVCGSVLELDTVVRIRKVQIVVDKVEQSALAVYWITDGVDRCRVGFLPRHLIKHASNYDGKLAQIVDFLGQSESPSDKAKSHRNKGVARAVIIEVESSSDEEEPTKRKRSANNSPVANKK